MAKPSRHERKRAKRKMQKNLTKDTRSGYSARGHKK